MESKWIKFNKHPRKDGAKTDVYDIVNKEYGSNIGQVKWFASWRKYGFFPAPNCVFETDCLNDIVKFLNKLTLERKVEKQNQK